MRRLEHNFTTGEAKGLNNETVLREKHFDILFVTFRPSKVATRSKA
jgi:hypothetical protein